MNLQKRENIRFCAGLGAAAGTGPLVFSSLQSSHGWAAAVVIGALISFTAASVASLAVRMLVRADAKK